jgi:hypothetical protein
MVTLSFWFASILISSGLTQQALDRIGDCPSGWETRLPLTYLSTDELVEADFD